jgi:pentatricopeptide repeat protein
MSCKRREAEKALAFVDKMISKKSEPNVVMSSTRILL